MLAVAVRWAVESLALSRAAAGSDLDMALMIDRLESLRALAPIEQDGLIHVKDGRITVVPEARPVVRTVCAAFNTYLTANKARHSLTI